MYQATVTYVTEFTRERMTEVYSMRNMHNMQSLVDTIKFAETNLTHEHQETVSAEKIQIEAVE